jgi:uncharacterized protein (TIGR02246 family)
VLRISYCVAAFLSVFVVPAAVEWDPAALRLMSLTHLATGRIMLASSTKEVRIMKADRKTEAAVRAVLERLAKAYAQRDMDLLISAFLPDPDVLMYGTGADEKRVGLAEMEAQARRDWSQSEAANIRYGWTSISAAGPVAWVATDAVFHLEGGGQQFDLPARATAVLEKRDDEWLIAQVHFSFAAAGQDEGESFPA